MKALFFFIFLLCSTNLYAVDQIDINKRPIEVVGFGICYSAYACNGISLSGDALISEDSCRQMGGNSLDVGGVCQNI